MVNQIPLIGQNEQRAKAAIGQALHQLTLQLYVSAAGPMLGESQHREDYHAIARESRMAAQAFFEGLGLVQFEKQPDSPPND